MRRVIDTCDKPFYERVPIFEDIEKRIHDLADTPRYPLFAANVLLPDVATFHREQALDRARCEAWTIALRAAAGKPVGSMGPNPVSGRPYDFARENDFLVVQDVSGKPDAGPSVRVSVLPD